MSNRKTRTHAIFEEHRKGFEVFCVANAEAAVPLETFRPGYMASVVSQNLIEQFESIGEMEQHLGMPPGSLSAQIAEFNEMIRRGRDEAYGRTLRRLKPLEKGPWFAARMTPRVHHCLGGIMTDPHGRALDARTQKPIPGLFAAGEAAGGVHGACRIDACAILDCLVMGRLAGSVAARENPGSK